MVAKSYKDIIIWQKAMNLVEHQYRISFDFPDEEPYGPRSQMTRPAVSIPANIAEDNARGSRREYAHFLAVRRGSHAEVETCVLLAHHLGYISEDSAFPALSLIDETGRMTNTLRSRLLSPSIP